MKEDEYTGVCHHCFKVFVLDPKVVQWVIDNKVVFPSWVCPDCREKDE